VIQIAKSSDFADASLSNSMSRLVKKELLRMKNMTLVTKISHTGRAGYVAMV
jgi:hypothetical protein